MESPVGVKGRKWQAADDSVIFKKNETMKTRMTKLSLAVCKELCTFAEDKKRRNHEPY